jgi:hypothetical protein
VFKDLKTILVDASERPYLRSLAYWEQQENYSGKKGIPRPDTLYIFATKNTLLAGEDTYIHYLGQTVSGSMHDYTLLKSELDVNLGLFADYRTLVDLGYLGMDQDYFTDSVQLPHRKPRKSKKNPHTELTQAQKQENREHATIRVKVENAIAGSKRLGIVAQVYRNKSLPFNDRVMAIACGIWNFHLMEYPLTI